MADTKTANDAKNSGTTDAGWTAPTQGAAPQQPQQQQVRVAVNEAGIRSVASNFFNATASTDGMAVDFGYWVPRRDNNGNFIQSANLDSRVVMSWAVAKRLSMDLGRIIREYEEQVGPINLGGQQQPQQG